MIAPVRLAIVVSHPIQYYAPWFRALAQEDWLCIKVFHLWDFGITETFDPGFQQTLRWDIDLLSGYDSMLVPNISPRPGTDHLLGLVNPGLMAALRAFSPDAVLAFGYSQWSLLELGLRCPWPLLLRGDSHALAAASVNRGLKAWLRQRILKRAAGHLAVGQANRDWLLRQGVDDGRIFRAPHAIDQARFRAALPDAQAAAQALRQRLSIAEDALLIGFVGKLEDKKQPLALIDAFRQLEDPNLRLVLVGSGPLQAAVDAACATDSRCRRLPFCNQTEIPQIYAMLDLLVLPSFVHETWGLVVNEAQVFGVPALLSSHVGGHPDLILSGQTGWVFKAGDTSALKAGLQEACRSRALLQAMRPVVMAHAQNFSYAMATSGLRQALSLIAGKPL
ncbi:glycosyl transferase [Ahniella affigens]|uniref:Glycosyl transferase n=1 Tax=Ahniella affigens TaxID=2021234 RepID=A0A2P1PYE8_9GAMM|nr:glycosyltransferase family 4 protein [Ahniella affigens]AVP99875.1 glycosyl transferase [Ahniella affigens]